MYAENNGNSTLARRLFTLSPESSPSACPTPFSPRNIHKLLARRAPPKAQARKSTSEVPCMYTPAPVPSSARRVDDGPTTSAGAHSFAASLTVPTLSFGAYFFRTDSLWYWREGVSPARLSDSLSSPSSSLPPAHPATGRPGVWGGLGEEGDTHLPELLARVLAADALQDLGPARVLVRERGHGVHAAVDDDVQAVLGGGARGDLGGGELGGHCARAFVWRGGVLGGVGA